MECPNIWMFVCLDIWTKAIIGGSRHPLDFLLLLHCLCGGNLSATIEAWMTNQRSDRGMYDHPSSSVAWDSIEVQLWDPIGNSIMVMNGSMSDSISSKKSILEGINDQILMVFINLDYPQSMPLNSFKFQLYFCCVTKSFLAKQSHGSML